MCALAILMGHIDRKSTLMVRDRGIGTGFDKNFDRFEVSVTRCPMQRGVATRQFHNVTVSSNAEQITHDFNVPPCCGTKQCSLANGISPVHVGTALNQTGDLLEVAAPCGSVKSRFLAPSSGGKNSVTHCA